MNANVIYRRLPNSDDIVPMKIRENPFKKNLDKQMEWKGEIYDDFIATLQKAFFQRFFKAEANPESESDLVHSRLLIADSLMEYLDPEIFKNMQILTLNYPKMPT